MHFSPSNIAFYQTDWKETYLNAGSWPDDAIEVTSEEFAEFSAQPPEGFMLGASDSGRPEWVAIPKPSKEQMLATAEQQRANLLSQADSIIADWRTELLLDEISDADKSKLSAWMAYKREVKSIVAENALGADFTWPEQPPL